MPKYSVELTRTITEYASAEIEADDPDQAYDLAEGLWSEIPAENWQTDSIPDETTTTVFDAEGAPV